MARICFDEQLVGEKAVRYFIDRGFRFIAYLRGPSSDVDQIRINSMRAYIKNARINIHFHTVYGERENLWFHKRYEIHHFGKTQWMDHWLKMIPKPAAIICRNDYAALRIMERFRALGIQIPEHVSLLGIGNDTDVSENSMPGISSLDFNFKELGETAATILHRAKYAESVQFCKPGKIIERSSTAIVGSSDPVILKASQYIQQKLNSDLSVGDIAQYCGVSRTTLNKHFRHEIGRAPKDEIVRQRVLLAKSLLSETTLSIKEVGKKWGNPDPVHFSKFFSRVVGASPKHWRQDLGLKRAG